jgi:glucokinase
LTSADESGHAIGIDVGVTNVKMARVTPAGEVLEREMVPTDESDPAWPERLRERFLDLEARGEKARWVGAAAPGIARADGKAIHWMRGRLDAVEGLDWTALLGRKTPVPVLNDAQAALLGETWLGAAAGARNAILLTLGTGVGGAAMVDGRLLRGAIGRAGHLGHMCLDIDGAPDIVGTPGSLEDAIGNCTIRERTGGRFETTHDLVAAHERGDAAATTAWVRSVQALACGVVSLVNVLDPEVVIIGGGIARAGEALFAPLREMLAALEWRPHGHAASVVPAALGEFAGALGSAWNAIQEGRA